LWRACSGWEPSWKFPTAGFSIYGPKYTLAFHQRIKGIAFLSGTLFAKRFLQALVKSFRVFLGIKKLEHQKFFMLQSSVSLLTASFQQMKESFLAVRCWNLVLIYICYMSILKKRVGDLSIFMPHHFLQSLYEPRIENCSWTSNQQKYKWDSVA